MITYLLSGHGRFAEHGSASRLTSGLSIAGVVSRLEKLLIDPLRDAKLVLAPIFAASAGV